MRNCAIICCEVPMVKVEAKKKTAKPAAKKKPAKKKAK